MGSRVGGGGGTHSNFAGNVFLFLFDKFYLRDRGTVNGESKSSRETQQPPERRPNRSPSSQFYQPLHKCTHPLLAINVTLPLMYSHFPVPAPPRSGGGGGIYLIHPSETARRTYSPAGELSFHLFYRCS